MGAVSLWLGVWAFDLGSTQVDLNHKPLKLKSQDYPQNPNSRIPASQSLDPQPQVLASLIPKAASVHVAHAEAEGLSILTAKLERLEAGVQAAGLGVSGFAYLWFVGNGGMVVIRLMDKILHDLKDSKLWKLWYIPYNG